MRTVILAFFVFVGFLPAQVVPRPRSFERIGETVCAGLVVRCDVAAFRPQVAAFKQALTKLGARAVRIVGGKAPGVVVQFERGENPGYAIAARGDRLLVKAEESTDVAHAVATLLQLVRIEDGTPSWPAVRVLDEPDLPFRCFMIDMGRNPHRPKTLRHVVDALWFYKVNYLHLHLSDDQLFSWPSKAFPELYSKRAGWTWDDFVALEAYSQARGVTIIPEIDVPGHSTILRRHYPEVFGKTPTDLATKPEAQKGLETLFTEILSVFRATPYVHIGGDEAYGVPATAQRDFINRLNAFVKKGRRRTLVWEGPHLGKGANKVASDVIHLNWNTVNFPAQQMLDAGYTVVNAAWNPMYIVDHYPRTMFTAVDLERCYRWDPSSFGHIDPGFPTFAQPHRTRTKQGVIGFCMPWWEGRETNLLGLCVPRLAAVAAGAWNRSGEADFAGFQRRQARLLPRLAQLSGFAFPVMPVADAATQKDNLAFGAKVTPSTGASQPVFGPQRLTNGIPARFDHFLGFPTTPEPLTIDIALRRPGMVGRVVVYERAVGGSYELYELFVSADGETFERVGAAKQGSRGKSNHVTHTFAPRRVSHLRIVTKGCHGLTFPSFSRLSEVMAFAK